MTNPTVHQIELASRQLRKVTSYCTVDVRTQVYDATGHVAVGRIIPVAQLLRSNLTQTNTSWCSFIFVTGSEWYKTV